MNITTSWTATITMATPFGATDEDLAALTTALVDHDAVIASGDGSTEATMTVAGVGAIDAGERAIDKLMAALFDIGWAGGTVTALEVIDVDEHDRRLAEPAYPELVGITEIAALLGVTRQRASALQTRSGFPQPLQVLASGPVWPRTWIDRFASTWERKGGRPAKQLPTSSTYSFDRDTDPAMAKAAVGDEITIDGAQVRVAARWVADDGPMITLHLEEISEPAKSSTTT